MTCEGKDLYILTQDELDKTYMFHASELLKTWFDLSTTDEEVNLLSVSIEHKISGIRQVYLDRFGLEATEDLQGRARGRLLGNINGDEKE